MYLHKVISLAKNVLKITEENSRIRIWIQIHTKISWIRNTGYVAISHWSD
jgi:hypothetical protein